MCAALKLRVAWAQNVGFPGVTVFRAALVATLTWAVSGVVEMVVTIIAAAVLSAVARAVKVCGEFITLAAMSLGVAFAHRVFWVGFIFATDILANSNESVSAMLVNAWIFAAALLIRKAWAAVVLVERSDSWVAAALTLEAWAVGVVSVSVRIGLVSPGSIWSQSISRAAVL